MIREYRILAAGRPDHVKCVLLGTLVGPQQAPERKTWCEREPPRGEFAFVDPTHAILHAREGGRLLLCDECAEAMARTIGLGRHHAR